MSRAEPDLPGLEAATPNDPRPRVDAGPCAPGIVELTARLQRRELSAHELARECLAAISDSRSTINAFITITEEHALAAARACDAAAVRGETLGPLHGLPVAVKDVEDMAGVPTTHGSVAFAHAVANRNSLTVERLIAAGAVIVGKTNMGELSLLCESKGSLTAPCRNPWDLNRTAGGSSGGSAAAVAARLVIGATGTDDAGSVRLPASFCGVWGLKPTAGRIPIYPRGASLGLLNAVGPIAPGPEELRAFLRVLEGPDFRDPLAVSRADDVSGPSDGRRRVGWCPSFAELPVDPAVAGVVERAAGRLAELGLDVQRHEPAFGRVLARCVALYQGEARGQAQRLLECWGDRLHPEAHAELQAASELALDAYTAAIGQWALLRAEMHRFFETCDLLLVPTVPVAAFPLDHPPSSIAGSSVAPDWTSLMNTTALANLTGGPALSFPAGLTDERLPVGAMLIGRPGDDWDLIELAAAGAAGWGLQ